MKERGERKVEMEGGWSEGERGEKRKAEMEGGWSEGERGEERSERDMKRMDGFSPI